MSIEIDRPKDEMRKGVNVDIIPDATSSYRYDLDVSRIDEFFPMPTYRDGQKGAIKTVLKAFNDGKKVVLIEAPTGSGKSVIGYTVANFFRYSYWLTIQKILQDQIIRDFGEGGRFVKKSEVIDMKGRNTYPCNYWDRSIQIAKGNFTYDAWEPKKKEVFNKFRYGVDCDAGYCKRNNRSKDSFCFPGSMSDTEEIDGIYSYCPYWQRRSEALNAQICLMNFSSFLFQTRVARSFGPRNLMIIDEAHNCESQLMNFIEFSISDYEFRRDKIIFPKLKTPVEYAEYFLEIELDEILNQKILLAKVEQKPKEENKWKQLLMKFGIFLESADSDNWVLQFKRAERNVIGGSKKLVYNTVTLKPIFIKQYAQRYMFSMTDHILMMSATLLSPGLICSSLGIDQDEIYSFRMKNRFPKENRKIIFDPCGYLNMRNKNETYPVLVEKVNSICKKHQDQRGIIHTHNFEISKLLVKECEIDVSSRFLFQDDWDSKQEMLEKHSKSKNTILVAPAMHEGLDLKDDLARFAVICKVPYPSMGDPQIKARMELSGRYYDWLTALKLVQSYGRTIRSEEDWAVTYIIDGGFEKFIKRANKLIPGWFKEAIIKS